MCTLLARDMGKKEIDRDVIRRYFLFEHGKAVMWRSRFFPDVNPRDCLVYPARVLDSRDRLMLRTPLGERIAKNSFETELRRNDWVSIHYDQIAERIDAETAKRMLGMRK